MTGENYKEIDSQADIDALMELYGGFHDSIVLEATFKSGCIVDDNLTMSFAGEQSKELVMKLSRQWKPTNIELCFTGVRRVHIVGYMSNYFPDIYCCHLAFHNDLVAGSDNPLIVWSDDGAKLYNSITTQKDLLREPMISYVIASKLKYKIG